MTEITRIETSPRTSRALIYNGVVYLCGMTAEDRSQDIRGQTQQALARKYLAAAGSDKTRILTTQIWIKDIVNDFAAMNEIWDAWTDGTPPTGATAQCDMASYGDSAQNSPAASVRKPISGLGKILRREAEVEHLPFAVAVDRQHGIGLAGFQRADRARQQ